MPVRGRVYPRSPAPHTALVSARASTARTRFGCTFRTLSRRTPKHDPCLEAVPTAWAWGLEAGVGTVRVDDECVVLALTLVAEVERTAPLH